MTKERLFKIEYAKELFAIAVEDLKTAHVLAKNSFVRKENILFHIQQAIEKALKGVICALEQPVPLVHDLALIIDRLPKDNSPPFASEIVDLSQFASIRRYEEGTFEFTSEEIQASLDAAEKIIDWSKKEIEGKLK